MKKKFRKKLVRLPYIDIWMTIFQFVIMLMSHTKYYVPGLFLLGILIGALSLLTKTCQLNALETHRNPDKSFRKIFGTIEILRVVDLAIFLLLVI